jgi:hypothetical protein
MATYRLDTRKGFLSMGSSTVRPADSHATTNLLQADTKSFLQMARNGQFSSDEMHIGWEFEVNAINQDGSPDFHAADKILSAKNQTNFSIQGEFGRHNAEINGMPISLASKKPFSQMTNDQNEALRYLDRLGLRAFGSGIFTSIQLDNCGELCRSFNRDLMQKSINPHKPRYQALLDCWERHVGPTKNLDFSLYGPLIVHSCAMESMIASFQIHLQINPEQAADALNIAAMISGPTQSPFVSSPRMFGKVGFAQEYRHEIWRQLFPKRTGMGHSWYLSLEDYLQKICTYEQWFESDDNQNSLGLLESGETPSLANLKTLIGSVWFDQRLKINANCLTIEERSKGSGSTPDNTAKAVFWIGLMLYYLKYDPKAWERFGDFEITERNYCDQLTMGSSSPVNWFGEIIFGNKLIVETLIPLAKIGLADFMDESEFMPYLDIVKTIVQKRRTVSEYIRRISKYQETRKSPLEIDQLISQLLHNYRFSSVINW